jgi:hypothetical protein
MSRLFKTANRRLGDGGALRQIGLAHRSVPSPFA